MSEELKCPCGDEVTIERSVDRKLPALTVIRCLGCGISVCVDHPSKEASERMARAAWQAMTE